jgi:hypothetical protein
MMAVTSTMHMMPNALIFPWSDAVNMVNWLYKRSERFPSLNLEVCIPSFPCNPKIRVRNGASMASEIRENRAERMLSEKYPITNFGYFFI